MFDALLVFAGMWAAGMCFMLIEYDHETAMDWVKSALWFLIFPWIFVSSFWTTDYSGDDQ